MTRHFKLPIFMVVACVVSACAVGPDYRRPHVDVPAKFRYATDMDERASLADLPWWRIFRDETLQGLVREALSNNCDLRAAIARVEQARQIELQTRSQFYPQVDYRGTLARGRNAVLGNPFPSQPTQTLVTKKGTKDDPSEDKDAPPPGGITSARLVPVDNPQTRTTALLEAVTTWELDLWGRIRRLDEASQANLMASEEARRGVVVTLVSNVAQAYFELLQLDLLLQIARKNTETLKGILDIFRQRLTGGVASRLETSTAEATLAGIAATIPDLERQIVLKENQINVLLGRNPEPIERNASLLRQELPPEVPAGLPARLLERRPDVREAEQRLRAANAQIGVSLAAFFPSVSLTGRAGKVSSDLSTFTSGTATMWSLAANLAGPIFHGGANLAAYRQSKAAWEEAVSNYEQTVINAFHEVSNALVSREKYEEVRIEQERSVMAFDDAVQVAVMRYKVGMAGYYEVLQNEQQLFPAENALAQTELNRLVAVVQLYRALGGGWHTGEAERVLPADCEIPARSNPGGEPKR